FVTSELYAALGHEEQVALAPWPEADEGLLDAAAEAAFERVKAAVTATRSLRAEADLPPGQAVDVGVAGPGAEALLEQRALFEPLARAALRSGTPAGSSLTAAMPDAELRLPLAGQVDVAAYAARQRGRLEKARAEAERSRKKLATERFVYGAPREVVAEERRRLDGAAALAARLEAVLADIGCDGPGYLDVALGRRRPAAHAFSGAAPRGPPRRVTAASLARWQQTPSRSGRPSPRTTSSTSRSGAAARR